MDVEFSYQMQNTSAKSSGTMARSYLNFSHLSLLILLSCISFNVIAKDKVVLQLRWVHQFQFAGYYAALEKGYYKEAGLDVEIRPAGPGKPTPLNEVNEGRAQYGVGNSGLVASYVQGNQIVAVAAIFQHSPNIWLTLNDPKLQSMQGLARARLMMTVSTENAELLSLFSQEGISIDSLNIIPSSFNIEDLIEGRVDAFNAYLTNEPYLLNQRDIEFNTISPHNYGIDFYSDVLFTSRQELQKFPDRVAAFREASLKGWKYALDNPEEIIDLIISKYNKEKSREHLLFEAEKIKEIIRPEFIEIGHMNPQRWKNILETYLKLGLVKEIEPVDDFIYQQTVTDWTWLKWLSGVLVTVILLILSIVVFLERFNRRLQSVIKKQEETHAKLLDSERQLKQSLKEIQILKEKEKEGIYKATVHSTQHILGNLLNQLTLVKLEIDKNPTFNKEVAQKFEKMKNQAHELLERLSSVEEIEEEKIKKSVYPK